MKTNRQCLFFETGRAPSIFASLRDLCDFAVNSFPTKNHLVTEYALSGIGKPIDIAEYQLARALPEPPDTCLSSIEEIEADLGRIGEDES